MEDVIHLVTVTNDKYAKPMAVMLNSLLINKKSKNPIHIYIIDSNISSEKKHKIEKALDKFDAHINFLTIDESMYLHFRTGGHLTEETYYRFSIPEILAEDVHKVIYLDSDIIVKDDITNLWEYDISNHLLAAVENPGLTNRFKELSIPDGSSYFNAGVLLINLKKWREDEISKKLLTYIKENQSKIKFFSQDPLNALLHKEWLQLDPKWNYQVFRHKHLKINPSIIHYTTNKKPWNSKKPYLREEYFKYLKETLW